MGSRQAGALYIDLRANTARLQKGMTKATAHVKKFKRNATRSLNSVKKAVFSLKGGFFALAGAGGMGAMIKSSFAAADVLGKTSAKLGVATDKLAGLHRAAELSGVSTETFNMALQRMTRRLSEAAQGTGEAQGAIKELGLDAKELAKLSPDEAFKRLAAQMGNVANKGDKVRLAMKLFDSEGVSLVNTMALGAEGLAKAQEEAVAFGTALTAVEVKKLENANDTFLGVGDVIKGVVNRIAIHLAPILEGLAKSFISASTEGKGMGSVVDKAMQSVTNGIGYVLTAMDYMQVGWQVLKLGVISFAALALNALDKIVQPIRYINELLGREQPAALKFLTKVTGDFEQAAIKGQAKLVAMIASVGDRAESVKNKIIEVTAEANKSAKTQVSGMEDGGDTPEKAAEKVKANAEAEREQRVLANALLLADQEAYNAQVIAADEQMARAKQDILGKTFATLSTLMASGSKRIFAIGKAAALAAATVSGLAAAQDAFKAGMSIGGPTAPAYAAAYKTASLVATGVQLAGIARTKVSGAREFGGAVQRGKSFLVGERGPEIFTPDATGDITANKDIGGASNMINVTVMANDAKSFDDQLLRGKDNLWNIVMDKMNEEGKSFA